MQSIFVKTAVLFAVGLGAVLLAPSLQAAPNADTTAVALRLRATEFEHRQSWLEAAATWQRLQELQPEDAEAFRQRVLALGQAGAAHLAYQLSQQCPALFSTDQRFQLAHAAAALTVVFGVAQQASQSGAQRYATLDLALDEERQITAQFGSRRSTSFDAILALRERDSMRATVALYQTLQQ